MKHTKKLIPAIGMLLLSACMLVTSTFAWFAMNETVTATGMSVTAKGDQVYLQIINPSQDGDADTAGHDNAFVPGKLQNTSVANVSGAKLLPTNVYKTFNATDPVDYDGGKDFCWVKATGTAVDDYRPSGNYTDVTATADGVHYLKNTFKIRLDPTAGAANSSAPLKVKAVTLTGDTADVFEDCLCVLVVCTYNNGTDGATDVVKGDLWSYVDGTFKHTNGTSETLTDGNMLKDTQATVDIYVFFNGDNENCDLETLAEANNSNYSVAVDFTVV